MSVPNHIPTGKRSVMKSLKKHLDDNLPKQVVDPDSNYTVHWDDYQNVNTYPSMAFVDMGTRNVGEHELLGPIGNLGDHAFQEDLGVVIPDGGGSPVKVYGKINRTYVEFNLQTDSNTDSNAVEHCLAMRDQLEYLFANSGKRNPDTGAEILPPIKLLDFVPDPDVDTNAAIWSPTELEETFVEKYIGIDPDKPGVKRYQILVRLYWHFLRP